ncbi:MAG TPA: TIGR04086 family membrane protein [Candidatus Limnocylindrales bacterium]|nr:TIGR04086 family membrane protein [Candidatus Limnocylindrales bacterium]
MSDQVYVRPAGTSWGAVLGGWVATVGMATLLAPVIAAIFVGAPATGDNIAAAVPFIVGMMLAYLVGGYVAGRMAGYNTSWHGLLTAFFGLFVVLIALLLVAAADQGVLAGAGIRSLADVFPGLLGLNVQTLGEAFTFGAIIGFLAAIFAGWLGGLLAPSHAAVVARPEGRHVERPAGTRRGPFRFLPSPARRNGGERVERVERVGPDVDREVHAPLEPEADREVHAHVEPDDDREVHDHPVDRR